LKLRHFSLPGWRRLFYDMRTEGAGREAASVGVGVFIGCLPTYGFHLLLVFVVGRLLRLNRLQMYVAANISNPLLAPLLILAEVQVGAWIRRGELHPLTLDAIRNTSPWTFGADLVVGSLIVGTALGLATALLTHAATARGRKATPGFGSLASRVADRYLASSITAWEFARAKLLSDPVYEQVICGGVLPSGRALLDVGCGQGLMLGLLAEARRDTAGPRSSALPVFDRLIGVELRPRIAAMARAALGSDAEILGDDVRDAELPVVDAVLAFDVLHMIAASDQPRVLSRLAGALSPGGVMLVREVDAAGGWRFRLVHAGNWLKALATGNWRQRFAFRTAAGWTAAFQQEGLQVTVVPMSEGTPFANVLFVGRKKGEWGNGGIGE
jgi:SAM-dependent methyltransferase